MVCCFMGISLQFRNACSWLFNKVCDFTLLSITFPQPLLLTLYKLLFLKPEVNRGIA